MRLASYFALSLLATSLYVLYAIHLKEQVQLTSSSPLSD